MSVSLLCPKGEYNNHGVCAKCPLNAYSPVAGMTLCLECPDGSKTLNMGSSTIQSCVCRQGLYLDTFNSFCSDCPKPTGRYLCPGTSSCDESPTLAMGGWWYPYSTAQIAVFQKCPLPSACPPGGCSLISQTICRKGHIGRLCFNCKEGWYHSSSWASKASCEPCFHKAFYILILLAIATVILGFGTLVLKLGEKEITRHIDNKKSKRLFIPKLRTIVFYVTLLICYGCIALDIDFYTYGNQSDKIPVSSQTLFFFRFLLALSFNWAVPLEWSHMECISATANEIEHSNQSLQARIAFAFALPLCIIFAFTFFWSALYVKRRRLASTTPFYSTQLIHELPVRILGKYCLCVSSTLWFVMPTITRTLLLPFICMRMAYGIKVVVFDPSVKCGTGGQHFGNLAYYGIGLWCIVVPCVTLWAITTSSTLLANGHKRNNLIFGFLTCGYRHPWMSWEVIKFIFIVFMVAAAMFDVGSLDNKLLIMLSLLGIFTFLHYRLNPYNPTPLGIGLLLLKPWKDSKNVVYHLEGLSLCVLLLTAIIALIPTKKYPHIAPVACIITLNSLHIIYLTVELGMELLPSTAFKSCRGMGGCMQKVFMGWFGDGRKDDKLTQSQNTSDMIGKELVTHKFGASLDEFILQNVRISPFPAEATAQLYACLDITDMQNLRVDAVTTFLFENGYIEPQTQTLLVVIPKIKLLYMDLNYEIPTQDAFISQMKICLDNVSIYLRTDKQIEASHVRAKLIREKLGVIRKVSKRDKTINWQDILGVRQEEDIANKWLLLNRYHKRPEDVNRIKAVFTYIFPSAEPVVHMEDTCDEQSTHSTHRGRGYRGSDRAQKGYMEQVKGYLMVSEVNPTQSKAESHRQERYTAKESGKIRQRRTSTKG